MPKPRKPIFVSHVPPSKPGWYAVAECWEDDYFAVQLNKAQVEEARKRYELCLAVDLVPSELWSKRRLRKRERGMFR